MLSASVCAGPGSRSRPCSNASTSGRAPSACTPSMRGVDEPTCASPQALQVPAMVQPSPTEAATVGPRPQLLGDLQPASSFPRRAKGSRPLVVPAVGVAGPLAHLHVSSYVPATRITRRDEELRDLGLGRELGNEDHRLQADAARRRPDEAALPVDAQARPGRPASARHARRSPGPKDAAGWASSLSAGAQPPSARAGASSMGVQPTCSEPPRPQPATAAHGTAIDRAAAPRACGG